MVHGFRYCIKIPREISTFFRSKNENKSVCGLEKKLDNVECKVNHSRLDVRRKSGKSEAIILFQLGETVVEFLDVQFVALFLVLVFAAASHLFCQC